MSTDRFCMSQPRIPASVKRTLCSWQTVPCSPAAETALQPLIWCSESLCSWAPSSPEECCFLQTQVSLPRCLQIKKCEVEPCADCSWEEIFYTPPPPGSSSWDCKCARTATKASIHHPLWVGVVVCRIGLPNSDRLLASSELSVIWNGSSLKEGVPSICWPFCGFLMLPVEVRCYVFV